MPTAPENASAAKVAAKNFFMCVHLLGVVSR